MNKPVSTKSKPTKQASKPSNKKQAIPRARQDQPAVVPLVSAPVVLPVDCWDTRPRHAGLASSIVSGLRKLDQYEAVCGPAISRVSFFAPTPSNAQQASEYAGDMVATLRDFARFGIHPVIFLEPTADQGILDLEQYRLGAYDTALDAYFATIKSQGVDPAIMGTWVLFPEGNIPVWNNIQPATFVTNVTKTAQALKKYYPSANVAIMLDSKSYPSGTSWAGGEYKSLLPYVSGLPAGLITSFGLQGFPWVPPANERGPAADDPMQYLQVGHAAEAARALGVREVWLNTGSLSEAYANSPARRVTVGADKRHSQLLGAVSQAKKLQAQGFTVSIHLFAENKSAVTEAINWSYWPSGQSATSQHTAVFKSFIHGATTADLDVWLFDAE